VALGQEAEAALGQEEEAAAVLTEVGEQVGRRREWGWGRLTPAGFGPGARRGE
jgi:hypothetical protein